MMNRRNVFGVFLSLLGILLSGCGKEEESPGTDPLTAPVDYLGAMGQAMNSAMNKTAVANVQSAIRMFRASEDRLPASLEELIGEGYMAGLPETSPGWQLGYDRQTGVVAIRKAR